VDIPRLTEEVKRLEEMATGMRDEIKVLKDGAAARLKSPDPPPQYDEGSLRVR
jgi:hypothetical protein